MSLQVQELAITNLPISTIHKLIARRVQERKSFNNRTCKYLNRLYSVGGHKTNSCPPSQQHSWHPFLFQVFLSYLPKVKGKLFNPSPLQLSAAVSVLPGSCGYKGCAPVTNLGRASCVFPGNVLPQRAAVPHSAPAPRDVPLLGARRLPQHSCSFVSGEHKIHRITHPHPTLLLLTLRGNSQSIVKKESKSSHMYYTKKNPQKLAQDMKFI